MRSVRREYKEHALRTLSRERDTGIRAKKSGFA